MQQIGPADRTQQLRHLLTLDGTLQDDFPGAIIAGAIGAGGLLANIVHTVLENSGTALWAGTERFLAREINFGDVSICIGAVLAKVKFRLQFGRELHDRSKGAAHLAAETLERTDYSLGNQFFDFLDFKLAAGGDFPQREVASLALELFVVLFDHSSAFGTRHA